MVREDREDGNAKKGNEEITSVYQKRGHQILYRPQLVNELAADRDYVF
jgi:hypothetical protein